jgi:benzoyl-CoA reductase subunit C
LFGKEVEGEMSTEKSLAKLFELSETIDNPSIQDWKDKGKKVMGFFCSYIPEELIDAAGILPYRMRPVGCTEVSLANTYMTGIHCTFARSLLEYILAGKFDFLDGVVSMNSCDHMRRIPDIYEKAGKKYPFMFFLHVPYKISEDSIEWYESEIAKLKKGLEEFTGTKITDEKLKESIRVYNDTRSLLKRLYELRQKEKPPITGSEALKMTLAATVIPKKEYNQLLKEALQEISGRPGLSNYKARLMIAGSALDDPTFIKTIEDLGGLVCTDALCFGNRYFWEPVETDGNLLGNLARSYLNRPCCPRIVNQFTKKDEYFEKLIKDYRIDGVIHERMRYCDLGGGDLLYVQTKLKEMNIPLLALEKEYWLTGVGQLRTRVQAFLESLEARR